MGKKNNFLTNIFQNKRVSQAMMMQLGWIDQSNDSEHAYLGFPATNGLWIKALNPVSQVPYRLVVYASLYLDKKDIIKRVGITIVDLDMGIGGCEYNVPIYKHDIANVASEVDRILFEKLNLPECELELIQIARMLGMHIKSKKIIEFCAKNMLEDTHRPAPDYPSNDNWSEQTHFTDDLYAVSIILCNGVICGATINNLSFVSVTYNSKPLLILKRDLLINIFPGIEKALCNDVYDVFKDNKYNIVVQYYSDLNTIKSISILDSKVYF